MKAFYGFRLGARAATGVGAGGSARPRNPKGGHGFRWSPPTVLRQELGPDEAQGEGFEGPEVMAPKRPGMGPTAPSKHVRCSVPRARCPASAGNSGLGGGGKAARPLARARGQEVPRSPEALEPKTFLGFRLEGGPWSVAYLVWYRVRDERESPPRSGCEDPASKKPRPEPRGIGGPGRLRERAWRLLW